MSIDVTTEKRFEADIEEFFLSPAGGYTHNNDMYDPQLGVYKDTLLRFIQRTQPKTVSYTHLTLPTNSRV